MKKYSKIYAVILVLIVFVFILSSNSNVLSNPQPRIVKVGYQRGKTSRVNIEDAKAPLDILLTRHSKENRFKSETILYNSMDEIISDLKENKLDVVNLVSTDYLSIEKMDLVEPMLVLQQSDEPLDVYLFLVHKDSGINTLADFKDKDLITEIGARKIISLMWLDTLLLKEGLEESKDLFRSHKKVAKAAQAVLPVFFGQADVCVTTKDAFKTMTEMNPQLKNDLKILLESPGYVCYLTCFNKQFPEDSKNYISNRIVDVDKSVEGQQIFIIAQLNKISLFKEEYLDTIRELYKEYNELISKKKGAQE